MPLSTSTTEKPRKGGRPPRDLCKRGHATGRYSNGTCKECQRTAQRSSSVARECKRAYYINNPEQIMLNGARERAKKGGYLCTITVADIFIPDCCPLLGMKLVRNRGGHVQANSPSLDKIRPELGYVPGNVWVISHRANNIKSDATVQELQTLVERLISALS